MPYILYLTLKRKWFDMILAGEKREEYREIKDHWARVFLFSKDGPIERQTWEEMLGDMQNPFNRHNGPDDLMNFFGVKFKEYRCINFRNGYRKDSPYFYISVKNLEIKQGKEEWGAEKDKFYFVFNLGGVLENERTD